MKRSEIFFGALLVPVDFLAIICAGIFIYAVRVSPFVEQFRPVLFRAELPLREFLWLVMIAAVVTIGIFSLLGLYAMQSTRRTIDEIARIASGVTLSAMGIIVWMFLSAELFESRFILIGVWVCSIIAVTTARYAVRGFQVRYLGKGYGVHRVLLVGSTHVAEQIKRQIISSPRMGLRVTGHVMHVSREELSSLYRNHRFDEVIQCDPSLSDVENLTLIDFCEDYKIDYKYVPNMYSTRVSNVYMDILAGYPIVELRRTPLDGWGRVVKRIIDIVLSVLGLIILVPLFLVVAAIIKVDSPGPVFFIQKRVGRNGELFPMVKFRTMVKDAEKQKKDLIHLNERSGPLFKIRNDPRVTRVGRILRRLRIDELPQLFNVLENCMSLIGPRPHLPEEVGRYSKTQRRLFTVKPGMTGLAQVRGSSDLSFNEEADLDIQYIERWNLKMDIQILLRTLWKLLWDRSAV